MKILLLGSTGTLGRKLLPKLLENFENVTCGFSENKSQEYFGPRIKLFANEIDFSSDFDTIINLAGYYPKLNDRKDEEKAKEVNIGIAHTIANHAAKYGNRVISFGSYFENCPVEFQPWSSYAISKKYSKELITRHSIENGFMFDYIYLYDNFGNDGRRKKFIDQLFDSIRSRETMNATPGNQIMDLISVNDIGDSIVNFLHSKNSYEISKEWQIRSYNVYSLRNIHEIMESIFNLRIPIRWGAIPYRDKEVFSLWDSAMNMDCISLKKTLEEFIEEQQKTMIQEMTE